MRKKTKIKQEKINKNKITLDEVMIQSSLIMIRTVAETGRGGANVKFQTEVDGEDYNIDVIIKKVKEKLHIRIWKYIKSLFDFASEDDNKIPEPKMKKV